MTGRRLIDLVDNVDYKSFEKFELALLMLVSELRKKNYLRPRAALRKDADELVRLWGELTQTPEEELEERIALRLQTINYRGLPDEHGGR